MNLILIGFQRVGKSYFGEKWAKQLKIPFLDTDELLVDLYKPLGISLTVAQLHRQLSEDGFRKIEERLALSLNVQNTLISCGGGMVLNKRAMKHLKSLGRVIFLSLSKAETLQRLKKVPIPSYLEKTSLIESFELMYQKRFALYQQYADSSLDITNLSDLEVLNALSLLCRPQEITLTSQ